MSTHGGYAVGDQLLDRYELVRYIDRGGMGIVWEARDLTLDRIVALKHVRFSDGEAAEEDRRRTLREARTAAKLSDHPHIITIYDVQEVAGDIWLVLEYLPSQSLAQLTTGEKTIDVSEAARIGAEVALALDAAHGRGIVHRDVKPGNILLGTGKGEVKLTDFGIAHAEGENPVTATNVVSGTPEYMAPEIARGRRATPASDMFSLGATLYRIVEGQPPFGKADNSIEMLQKVAHESPQRPRRAGPFGDILMHFLELVPNTRPTAVDGHRMLDDFARRLSDPTKPPSARLKPPRTWAVRTWSAVRRPRRRTLLVVAAVVVVALVATGITVLGLRTASGIPALPDTVEAIKLTGDPRAADPCALFDEEAVAGMGRTKIGPGDTIGDCRLTIDTPGGQRVYNNVHFGNTVAEGAPGPTQRLGELTIAREGTNPRGCSSDLVLADNTLVSINSRFPNSRIVGNLCEYNEAVVAVAVDRLSSDGITYRPGWIGDVSLAREQACDVPGNSLAQIPGLVTTQRASYLNGATCFVGEKRKGAPYLAVTLGLEPNGDLSGYGTASTIDGKPAFSRPLAGYYNPTACRLSLEHRPSYRGSVQRPTEFIAVQVEGTLPYDQLCQQAGVVAAAAEKSVSP